MLRKKFKWRSHENESTDARHRGGSSCSSVEGPVMGLSEGDEPARSKRWSTRKLGGAGFFLRRLETVRTQEEGWQERYDGRLSRTDL